MGRRVTAWLIGCALIAPDAAYAQFGSFLNSIKPKRSAEAAPADAAAPAAKNAGCDTAKPASAGKKLLGKIMNNVADKTVGRGVLARYVPIPEVAGVLTDAIACRLDQGEQRQAATATATATRSAKIGATSSWTSESRPEVSGSSTVIAREASADGSTCLTVNDVVIVNGEETTVPKKMCRAKGASGFAIAA